MLQSKDKIDVELLFENGTKSIFDKLIWRILHGTQNELAQALKKYYYNGQYCYILADILKDNNMMEWINFAPWDKVRKVWLKIVSLFPYLGTERAYSEILRYIFYDNIDIKYESAVTEQIYNESLTPETYYKWQIRLNDEQIPGSQKTVLWTKTKTITEEVEVYEWDDVAMEMIEVYKPVYPESLIIKSHFEIIENFNYPEYVNLKVRERLKYLSDFDSNNIVTSDNDEKYNIKKIVVNEKEIFNYELTGETKEYIAKIKHNINPGVLNIYIKDDGSLFNKFLFMTDNIKLTVVQYVGNELDKPIYFTEAPNYSLSLIDRILNLLTPVGLVTKLYIGDLPDD